MYFNKNTIVLPLSANWYRLFQPVTRRNAIVNLQALSFLCGAIQQPLNLDALQPKQHQIVDATKVKLTKHAYCNSDNFSEELIDDWSEIGLSAEEATDFLIESAILIKELDQKPQLDKQHFADRYKGNFYEQIATECLMQRQLPEDWWVNQKFESDHSSTRHTPYQYVQDVFLRQYFKDHLVDKVVIEIGCGTGYYTKKIAEVAKQVTGIDYNANYIETARDTSSKTIDYQVVDITEPDFHERLGEHKYDYVFLIDTFLFLFDDRYQNQLYLNRHQVVKNIARLMDANTTLVIMDPHPLWLTPWVGSDTMPMGVLTEYRSKQFKVIPTLSEMTSLLNTAGICIKNVYEPDIDPQYETIDKQAYHFMREFPQWWVFEGILRSHIDD